MKKLLTCLFLITSTVAYADVNSNGDLPDPKLSPGDIATSSKDDICNKHLSKSRNVSQSEKMEVFHEYGLKGNNDGWCGRVDTENSSNTKKGCEIDHIISLELGGSNDKKNLWPQPYIGKWNAHQKDAVENRLHSMICKDQISVEEAQKGIATNWISLYVKLFPDNAPSQDEAKADDERQNDVPLTTSKPQEELSFFEHIKNLFTTGHWSKKD